MKKKSEKEITKLQATKIMRTALRLKYSLLADLELYEKLPELEETIDEAYRLGTPWRVKVAELFDIDPKLLGY